MIGDLRSKIGVHEYKSHMNNSVTAKLTCEDKKMLWDYQTQQKWYNVGYTITKQITSKTIYEL